MQVNVGKGSHPSKVKVFGPGVERSGLKANEPTHFTVDCSGAGDGKSKTYTHARTLTHTRAHRVSGMCVLIWHSRI